MAQIFDGYEQGYAGYYKKSDGSGPYAIDSLGRAVLFSDQRLLTGATNPRLRVDVGETGFYEGREFRSFKEWATATTGSYAIKVVAPVNLILQELNIGCEEGHVRMETRVGGTEGGTFSEELPRFATNNMSEKPQPPYASAALLTAGGTHTGGTVLDVVRVKTSDNSNFASSVGGGAAMRGVAPSTYYFAFALTAFVGTFKARWEERP